VTDKKSAERFTSQSYIESILQRRSDWKPMPLVSLEQFEDSQDPFLLYYSTGPFAWLFSRLQQERPRQMTVVSTFGEAILFRVEPTAYSGTRSLP
jgi:hypothetical protein